MSENEDNGCFMLDIFGQRAYLNFKGRGVSKSNCGVCFTYLFIIFFFWSIFHTGRDIVFREEPETVESEKFIDSPEKVELSPDTFNLAFGIQDPSSFEHYIDESIYKAKAFLQILERVQNPSTGEFMTSISRKDLQLVSCRREHLGARLGAKIEETMNIEKLLCIELNPNEKLIVEGRFENKYFTHVGIEFSACDRTQANHNCADQSVIDAKLLGAYYAVYLTDQAINPSDFKNPGQKYLNPRFTTIGKDYFKEYTTYIRPVKVTSDTGYLFSDESTLELYQFGKLQENSDFRKFPNFLKHTIRVDQITKFYIRRYIKLQDILSEVDGLITLAIIILLVLIYPFIKMKFYQDLVNEVFDLKIYNPIEKNNTLAKLTKFSQKSIPMKQMREKGRASILIRGPSKKFSSERGLPSFNSQISKLKTKDSKSLRKIESLLTEEQNLMQQISYMPPTTTERGLIQQQSSEFDSLDMNKVTSQPNNNNNSSIGGILKTKEPLDQIPSQQKTIIDKETEKKQNISFTNMSPNKEKQDNDMPQTHFPYKTQMKSSLHFADDGNKVETLKTEGDDQTMIAIPVSIDDFNVYNEKNNDLSNLNRQSSIGGVNLIPSDFNQNDEIQRNTQQKNSKKVKILPRSDDDVEEYQDEDKMKDQSSKKEVQQNSGLIIQGQSIQGSSLEFQNDKISEEVGENSEFDEADEELEELIKNSLDPKRNKLDISLFDYLRSIFTNDTTLKKKMEIFNEGERRIRERMDVFNIIMKLREIDKLKNILLDKNQLALFDNLPRPVLDIKSRKVIEERSGTRFAALTQGNFIQRVKKDQIFKAVKAIMSKEEKTSVDEKLLDVYIDLLS